MKANVCMLVTTLLFVVNALATEPGDVVITGERSPENNKDFIWTITNNGDHPIKLFRAQHYLGKEVTPPPRWEEGEMTGHIGRGHAMRPGIVEYRATGVSWHLRPGRTMTCQLRLDNRWLGKVAKKTVQVVLADGTELAIPKVLCPASESFVEQNMPLIGLGVMFAVFVLYKVIRGGKKTPAAPAAADSPGA